MWTDPPDQQLLREEEYLYARGEIAAGRTAWYALGCPGSPRPTVALETTHDLNQVFPLGVRRGAERRERNGGRS